MERNEVIKEIKNCLQTRSGKPWSVTGGRGTAWGWITIDAPPARRTAQRQLKPGALDTRPEDYQMVNTGQPGGSITAEDSAELAKLLGLESVHGQDIMVAASSDYRDEYIARARGETPAKIAQPYWD